MYGQHVYRTGNQWGMTVRELINKVAEEGLPVRLNWSKPAPPVSSPDHGNAYTDYPTGVLPATIIRELDELTNNPDLGISA